MGCGCGKADYVSDPQTRGDADLARRLQQEENQRARAGGGGGASQRAQPSWGSAGTGHSLGGGSEGGALSAEERRQR
eukprot:CAMPEP_0179161552 /NCGR_PEP_ID=MMETSP0796-20121207/79093_1 /TAXON_ID=73915 /ORGANISM="Pyrodinium bahamense, Strain pbaha01" /LENGTH=76 /DNA_ID=CAMNT_0020863675 /DNA_START=14 /DNA_END=240 /DNA_ORIENTATION=+